MGKAQHGAGCRGQQARPRRHRRMMTESFEYFMFRVRRSDAEPGQGTGHVERLGTGAKRGFGSGDDLARLVATWPADEQGLAPDRTAPAVPPETTRGPS